MYFTQIELVSYIPLLLLWFTPSSVTALQLADSAKQSVPLLLQHRPKIQFHINMAWMQPDRLPGLGTNLEENRFSLATFRQGDNSLRAADHITFRRRLGLRLMAREVSRAAVMEDVAAYAHRYREEFAKRNTVFFSHISKSSGTTLCSCGWNSGCNAQGGQTADNCDATPGDAPDWLGSSQNIQSFKTCQALVEHNVKNHYTLEGNQNHLIQDGLCPQFWNVIVLRDPMDRVFSHINLLSQQDQGTPLLSSNRITPKFLFENAPLIANNFVIRNLIGPKGYKIPFGNITQEHLEEAKQRLESFDLVFITSDKLLDDVQQLLGWKCASHGSTSANTALYQAEVRRAWSQHEINELQKANELDRALFEHARILDMVDRQVLQHPTFSEALYNSTHDKECRANGNTGQCGFLCK